MDNKKETFADFQETVMKIIEILNGRSAHENKKILEKVSEVIENSSVLNFPIK